MTYSKVTLPKLTIANEWLLRRIKLEKNLWLVRVLTFLRAKRLTHLIANHWRRQMEYEAQLARKIRAHGRIFLGYEGSLDCYGTAGRDSGAFCDAVFSRMSESFDFIRGHTSERIYFNIVMNHPSDFPLDHFKYSVAIRFRQATRIISDWAIPSALAASLMFNIYSLMN
ncbi:hypothetical protein Gekk315_00074 [Aeromonas phage Gekk3-15]